MEQSGEIAGTQSTHAEDALLHFLTADFVAIVG